MKKFIAPLLSLAVVSTIQAKPNTAQTLEQLEQQVKALQAQIEELKSAQVAQAKQSEEIASLKTQLTDVKKHDSGDNIKWNIDFRTAYDHVNYKINDTKISPTGKKQSKTSKKHNGIWTNKLILGMSAKPLDNLAFHGSVGVYKAFGQNNIAQSSYFQNFDWYDSQKPNDTTLRLREAYFLYSGNLGEVPYNVSFGRRPSIDGFLANLRSDVEPGSPTGHNINMQFDGASFKFDLDKITQIDGAFIKLCLGRGFSETTGAYSMNQGTMGFNPGYINDDKNPDMDLAGLILQFYDNGQYKLMGNYFIAKNLMDMDIKGMAVTPLRDANGRLIGAINTPAFDFTDVGDMSGGALSFQINGIGNGINDFLDDTILFASYAFSKTKPNKNKLGAITPMGIGQASGMLGSEDSKFGSSIYVGVQMPGVFDGDRFGLEYNHGSKYWRSFTYGEDTLVGSKLAARGNAYEAYYKMPILGENLTAQLNYIYIDYDYTGSDTFFGWTGTPMKVEDTPGAIKSAQQIRAQIRYRY